MRVDGPRFALHDRSVNGRGSKPQVVRYAETEIQTRAGLLRLIVYRTPLHPDNLREDVAPEEHMAIVAGNPEGDDVLVRIHSECWTGETLGSLKCDCREQLEHAIEAIVKNERGLIVYLRQEGRGIGLGNKVRAYALQNQGADTVEANTILGFAPDLREYGLAAAILDDLGVTSLRLMTNNPEKMADLEAWGVRILGRVPHWVSRHEHNRQYLEVKKCKLGHYD